MPSPGTCFEDVFIKHSFVLNLFSHHSLLCLLRSAPQRSSTATIQTQPSCGASSSQSLAASSPLAPHFTSNLLPAAAALAPARPLPARPSPPCSLAPVARHLGDPFGTTSSSPAGGRRGADAHQPRDPSPQPGADVPAVAPPSTHRAEPAAAHALACADGVVATHTDHVDARPSAVAETQHSPPPLAAAIPAHAHINAAAAEGAGRAAAAAAAASTSAVAAEQNRTFFDR